jgi:hypothetical protein
MARDVLRHEVPSDPWVKYSPAGKVKCGCDEHPVESIEHVTQLPPAVKGTK